MKMRKKIMSKSFHFSNKQIKKHVNKMFTRENLHKQARKASKKLIQKQNKKK
jgi:hypothetical protein